MPGCVITRLKKSQRAERLAAEEFHAGIGYGRRI